MAGPIRIVLENKNTKEALLLQYLKLLKDICSLQSMVDVIRDLDKSG